MAPEGCDFLQENPSAAKSDHPHGAMIALSKNGLSVIGWDWRVISSQDVVGSAISNKGKHTSFRSHSFTFSLWNAYPSFFSTFHGI